jgi:hypothetical protein
MAKLFWLASLLCGTFIAGTAAAAEPQPPDCKLEPGPGPMRCADPKNPESFFALKHILFAFVDLDIPHSKERSPLCIVFTPQEMLESNTQIPDYADPDAPVYRPYYVFMTYKVSLVARRMTILQLTDRKAEPRNLNLALKLYDVPQADWPCSLNTWVHLIANEAIDISEVPDRRYK